MMTGLMSIIFPATIIFLLFQEHMNEVIDAMFEKQVSTQSCAYDYAL